MENTSPGMTIPLTASLANCMLVSLCLEWSSICVVKVWPSFSALSFAFSAAPPAVIGEICTRCVLALRSSTVTAGVTVSRAIRTSPYVLFENSLCMDSQSVSMSTCCPGTSGIKLRRSVPSFVGSYRLGSYAASWGATAKGAVNSRTFGSNADGSIVTVVDSMTGFSDTRCISSNLSLSVSLSRPMFQAASRISSISLG